MLSELNFGRSVILLLTESIQKQIKKNQNQGGRRFLGFVLCCYCFLLGVVF